MAFRRCSSPLSRKRALTLATGALALGLGSGLATNIAQAEMLDVEKDELKFGFIKLTDMAPIAIAYEKGYFEDEGLYVTLEAQANWKVLLDRVITGELDGAHMLAGQPLAATIGFGTKAHIVTPISMDLNGNGITVSNEVWAMMKPNIPVGADGKPVHPIKADALKPVIEEFKANGKPFNMGMVFPVSTHNYELRYWLASGGIHPGFYSKTDISGQIQADALLSVTPPPQMPATLEAGTISGYCVGEPWNQQAVIKGVGVPVITDYEIWKNNPEKVFGLTAEFTEKYPNTTLALTKALIRAAKWLDEDNNANRMEAVKILSQSEYVGADPEVIANSMTGTFEYEKGDKRDVPDFNVFYRYYATYPYYSDAVWYLYPDAPLGPDRHAQGRCLVRGSRRQGLPPRYLPEGRPDAGRGRPCGGSRLPLGYRRLPCPAERIHRRHHLRRAPAERLPQETSHRPEGRADRRWLSRCWRLILRSKTTGARIAALLSRQE